MADNVMKQLKELVSEFVDSKGLIREKPLGRSIRMELSQERIEFLRQFVDLLLNTNYLTDETKLYISNKYITAEGVYEELKEKNKDINLNTVKSKIYYDRVNKIIARFSDRVLVDVIEYRDSDITSYKSVLSRIRVKKCSGKLLNNIALKLPESELCMNTTDEDFTEFVETIMPYTKSHMKAISTMINAKVVGYIQFILSSELLTEEDMKRKARIMEILGETED